MKKAFVLFAACWGVLAVGLVWADGVLKPAHGGRMVEVAKHRLELATTASGLVLYVTDHDNRPVALDKASGSVTWLGASGKVVIPLTPAGENRLEGPGDTSGWEKAAAIITVEGASAQRLTARLPAGQP